MLIQIINDFYKQCVFIENVQKIQKIYFVLSISNDAILRKNIKIFRVCKRTYIKSGVNAMFKVSYFMEVLPIIASKVNVTFELTIAATIFALLVGVIIAIIGYYKIPVLYQITRVYVSIMRGTPVVAQLYFFYYGVALYSAFVRDMTPLIAVAVVMSMNEGAFMSESIRGALMSVDEGQKEAAYSLGMKNLQLVTRIVIPQAVRVALPPLFNDVINLIKMTSLAFMLGVPDIMGAAKIEGARTFRYFEIYAAVMLIYWLIIFVLGLLHKLLEKKCANMY